VDEAVLGVPPRAHLYIFRQQFATAHLRHYQSDSIKFTGPMAPHTTLEVDSSGVAVVTLHNPPVNALHPSGKSWLNALESYCMHVEPLPLPDCPLRPNPAPRVHTALVYFLACSASEPVQQPAGGTGPARREGHSHHRRQWCDRCWAPSTGPLAAPCHPLFTPRAAFCLSDTFSPSHLLPSPCRPLLRGL
jgi:hypothetical protein